MSAYVSNTDVYFDDVADLRALPTTTIIAAEIDPLQTESK